MLEEIASGEEKRIMYGFIPYTNQSVSECFRDVISNTEKLKGPIITKKL